MAFNQTEFSFNYIFYNHQQGYTFINVSKRWLLKVIKLKKVINKKLNMKAGKKGTIEKDRYCQGRNSPTLKRHKRLKKQGSINLMISVDLWVQLLQIKNKFKF